MTPYSAEAAGSFSSRASSRSTALRASSGSVDLVRAVTELLISACSGSPSPSSSWIAFSCWRRKYSRWRGLHLRDDLVLDLRAELRDLELAVEDHEHGAQALLDVVQLEQLLLLVGLQAQRRGDEVAERARVVDVGRGERELLGEIRHEADQACEERLHVLLERLRLGRLLVARPEPHERPTRYGSSWSLSISRMRRMPWTRMRSEPSGTRSIFCTTAAVPISCRSSQPGCSTSAVLRRRRARSAGLSRRRRPRA